MAKRKNRFYRKLRYFFKPTVGRLLGLLMAAYFIFSFISIHGRSVVNYYEVEEGSLVKEHDYTGLIIRHEETVPSEASGYIYYYVADGRKVASGNPVYLIDADGDLSYYLSSHSNELNNINSSKLKEIRAEILSDSRSFSDSSFHADYEIYDNILAKAVEYSSLSIFNSISDELTTGGISIQKFPSSKNGTVCCYTDGYEDIDENNLTAELFDQTKYEKSSVKAGDLIEAGAPAYKLITDENWYIAFMLSDENIENLKDSTTLKISFPDKGFDTKASFKIIYGSDGIQYGLISLNSYLVQFTSDRFIKFDIVTNDVSGLKIPDKAITTKDFYVIPASYLTEDSSGNVGFNKAVVGENGTSYEFVITDIYSKDDDYCYIECDDSSMLKAGDYVMLPYGAEPSAATVAAESASQETEEDTADESSASAGSSENQSSDGSAAEEDMTETFSEEASADENSTESSADIDETSTETKSDDTDIQPENPQIQNTGSVGGLYQIAAKMPLKGVYNVNKGYAVFRKVEILESSNGYSIIKKNTSYGLQTYDHIVLDASSVQDGDILYR